jgi:hypothetical protein
MINLLSQVQQLLLKRDPIYVTKKMDKDTCIAKLRTCKSRLETVSSRFTDQASMFQEGVRLCDEMIQDGEAHACVNQHALVNLACICSMIVLKCETILCEHKHGPQHDKAAAEGLEFTADLLQFHACHLREFPGKVAQFAEASEQKALRNEAYEMNCRTLAREYRDWALQPKTKVREFQTIASEFKDRASEFEMIARQSKAGVYVFEPSASTMLEKGGIN